MSIELKPCPFCGGKAELDSYKDESIWSHEIVDWFKVSCTKCEIETAPSCENNGGAIETWNRRAT